MRLVATVWPPSVVLAAQPQTCRTDPTVSSEEVSALSTWLSEWRIVGRTFHASSEAVPRWLLAGTAPGASLAATQAVLAALRREVHREGLVHHQLPHPGRAAARAGLQQRRQRELLTWRTVKMIYVGAVHNFWAAEVTGKSHRVALPPRPQQRVGVWLGWGGGEGGRPWGEGGAAAAGN